MNKTKSKKSEPKLEYLQDPKTLETPGIIKPLYQADEKLRQKLSPDNIGKEIKWFRDETGKMIKKVKQRK